MSEQKHDEFSEEVTLEETQELMGFLQGNVPEGWTVPDMPRLTRDQAFAVVYYLQEGMGLISDRFELCSDCGSIFDSNCEGGSIDSEDTEDEIEHGVYCDDCYAVRVYRIEAKRESAGG